MMLTLGMNLSDWAYSCIKRGIAFVVAIDEKYRIDQKMLRKKFKTDFDSDKEVGFGLNFK
jgi:hypothetical protein